MSSLLIISCYQLLILDNFLWWYYVLYICRLNYSLMGCKINWLSVCCFCMNDFLQTVNSPEFWTCLNNLALRFYILFHDVCNGRLKISPFRQIKPFRWDRKEFITLHQLIELWPGCMSRLTCNVIKKLGHNLHIC